MARPPKQGLEYFPLDTDMDDKIAYIEDYFGLSGFAVVIKLYQKIYKNGYWCRWDNILLTRYAKQWDIEKSILCSIVDAAAEQEIFDRRLFGEYGILTSNGIQKRYYEIVNKRVHPELEQKYIVNSRLMDYYRSIFPEETGREPGNNPSETGERKEKEKNIKAREKEKAKAREKAIEETETKATEESPKANGPAEGARGAGLEPDTISMDEYKDLVIRYQNNKAFVDGILKRNNIRVAGSTEAV